VQDEQRTVPLGLLLNELVSNAYKHAFRASAGGQLRAALHSDDGDLLMNMADTGVGHAD
jgi:two-component sensor histidine kinase